MISAAVSSYLAGYCGLVIAEGDTLPLDVKTAQSFEIGRLVPASNPTERKDKRRELTPDDLRVVSDRICSLVREAGAEKVYVAPGAVGDSVAAALGEVAVRSSYVGTREPRHDYVNWRPSDTYRNLRAAAAILAYHVELGKSPVARRRYDVSPAPVSAVSTPPSVQEVSTPNVETQVPPREEAKAAPLPPVVQGEWPRMGIDPGSSHVGLVIVGSDGRVLHRCTLDVGHNELLPKPKVIKRFDGTSYEKTTTHVVSVVDVENLIADIDELVEKFQVQKAVIEWITNARVSSPNPALAASIATQIARSQWIGGGVHLWLRAKTDVTVELVTQKIWSTRVTGTTSKGRRGAIALTIESKWPELIGDNEHVRDAAGCVLYTMTPEPEKRVREARKAAAEGKPVRRAHHTSEGKSAWHEARAAERKSAREAAGCKCGPGPHRKGCPLRGVKKMYAPPRKAKSVKGIA